MPQERNAFRVGVVLLAMVLAFAATVMFIPGAFPRQDSRAVRARFPHTYRLPLLEAGSLVLAGGQKVGAVRSVELIEQPVRAGTPDAGVDLFVLVTADVRRDLKLHSDCKLIPEGPPLGGPGTLILEVGYDPDPLPDDAVIVGAIPSGFAAVLQTVNDVVGRELDANNPDSLLGLVKNQLDVAKQASLIAKLHRSMDDFNAVTRSVRDQTNPEQHDALFAKLSAIMDNLNRTSAALREQLETGRPDVLLAKVHAALDSLNGGLATAAAMLADARTPVRDTIAHLSATAETVDTRIVRSLAEQTDARNAAGLIAKLNVAMDELQVTLKNVSIVTDTAREVAVLNRDNIHETIRNLKQTSEQAKLAVKFVLRRPWLLFNQPTETESRQKDILDAASNFQDAAARLDDATSDLRALAELHSGQIPADDPKLTQIRGTIEQSFKRFREAEAVLFEELKTR